MRWLTKIFENKNNKKEEKKNNLSKEEQALYKAGREQFIRLREKGLSIPIFTL